MNPDPKALSVFYSQYTTLSEKSTFHTSEILELCMEYDRPPQAAPVRHRLLGRQSSPALPQIRTPERTSPHQHSSPLPQTQWSNISTPQRPRGYPNETLFPAQQYTPGPDYSQRHVVRNPSEPSPEQDSQRRRRRGFRDLLSRDKPTRTEQTTDASLLYPEMNPYSNNDRLSSYSAYSAQSAPDELEYFNARSVSHTSAPGLSVPSANIDIPSPASVPRSPTYPPAGRRRMHSSTGVGEAAFEDEAEFRLFVEATAGLGPEQVFRQADPMSPSNASPRRTQSERVPHFHQSDTRDIVSPLSDTPTTRFALHHLAQMPEGAAQHYHRERMHTSYAGLDLWLQPPTTEPEDLDVHPEEDFDDELPDYAESQAQAQQHQRAEAARRAQELQRRWQLSGSRRGI